MEQIVFTFFYVSSFSILLPMVLLAYRRKSLKDHLYKVFAGLLLVSAASDALCYIAAKSGTISIPINNLFNFVQFLAFSLLYSILLERWDKVIHAIGVLYVISFALVWTFGQPIDEIQTGLWITASTILIIYSILFVIELFETMPTARLGTYSPFWINSAVMFYFGFSFYLFMTSTYFFEHLSADESKAMWTLHNINNTVKNLIFAWAVWHANKPHLTPEDAMYERIRRQRFHY